MSSKACIKCGKTKAETEFDRNGKYIRNECSSCQRARVKRWTIENRERSREIKRGWILRNKEKMDRARLSWNERNKDKIAERCRRYQAKKLKATPDWANRDKMTVFYNLAQTLSEKKGVPHEVDHIVPLTSRIVCGLHVETNLQVIERRSNRSKGNRRWPDMPMEA